MAALPGVTRDPSTKTKRPVDKDDLGVGPLRGVEARAVVRPDGGGRAVPVGLDIAAQAEEGLVAQEGRREDLVQRDLLDLGKRHELADRGGVKPGIGLAVLGALHALSERHGAAEALALVAGGHGDHEPDQQRKPDREDPDGPQNVLKTRKLVFHTCLRSL